jgi:diguanylate cyclase (GGDEF)-like protein
MDLWNSALKQEQRAPETAYRQHYLPADTRLVVIGTRLWLAAYLAFLYFDAAWPTPDAVLALRIGFVLLALIFTLALPARARSPQTFDRLVLLWGLTSVLLLGLIHSSQVEISGEYLVELAAVFSLYFIAPGQAAARVLPPLLLTAWMAWRSISVSQGGLLEPYSVVFALGFSNLLGFTTSDRFFTLRRKAFLAASEKNRAITELKRLASTDSLTGVLNRRRLLELAQDAFQRFNRYQRPFTILLMDLDGFKQINDIFGHQEGDKTLIQFAEMVMREKRDVDIFGRMGGDEFCLLLAETIPEDAVNLSKRIVAASIHASINDGGLDVHVSVSIGATQALSSDASLDAVFARADAALFQAKEAGRSQMKML